MTLTGPWSFIDQVADACDLTAAQISEATEKGAVWWQKQDTKKQLRNPVRLGSFENTVKAGDVVLVNYNSAILAANIAPPVLVSDQVNYSIWDKPRGMLSQGTKWSNHCSITYCVEKIHNKRAFLVHRLDRAAGGLIVIAHTRNALTRLAEMFAKRQIEKTYQATVSGKYDGKIPLVIETPVDGKSAHTELIDAVAKDGNASPQTRLTVKIKTGRKHQIRSHLAGIGHPVVGDRLFDKNTEHQHDLQLDAVGLKFTCPFADRAINVVLPHV
ncbi:hypothetical protein AB833_04645 [Chromatiales bacterium (ex Bugula neritina AB1)]|nr:hypothetical protein AB833_04645 [Chromatiales bacterium (ex Bugula neritina AB1)]